MPNGQVPVHFILVCFKQNIAFGLCRNDFAKAAPFGLNPTIDDFSPVRSFRLEQRGSAR
jgi:hypothetical protein